MNTINWEIAPEGYPLWLEYLEKALEGDDERRKQRGVWVKEQSDRFVTVKDTFWSKPEEGYYRIHKRPSSPAWSGPQDGLPPIGVKCLLSGETEYIKPFHPEWAGTEVIIYANFKTERGTPLAAYASECGLRAGVGIARLFLPCRTPEQKAADERDAAVNQMVEDTQAAHGWTEAFQMLHDAGYRKVEQPK